MSFIQTESDAYLDAVTDSVETNNFTFEMHVILTALAFMVILPISIMASRYFKELFENKWIYIHIGGTVLSALSVAAGVYVMFADLDIQVLVSSSPFSTSYSHVYHKISGLLLVGAVGLQTFGGAAIQYFHNAELIKQPIRDRLHGLFGKVIVLYANVNILQGIYMAHHFGFIDTPAPYYITFALWTLVIGAVFVWLERSYGVSSRYIESNVFLDASLSQRWNSKKGKKNVGEFRISQCVTGSTASHDTIQEQELHVSVAKKDVPLNIDNQAEVISKPSRIEWLKPVKILQADIEPKQVLVEAKPVVFEANTTTEAPKRRPRSATCSNIPTLRRSTTIFTTDRPAAMTGLLRSTEKPKEAGTSVLHLFRKNSFVKKNIDDIPLNAK